MKIQQESKMGIFDKIKKGLQNTKNAMIEKVELVINSFTKIDEDFFEDLEESLIMSDIGVSTATSICEELRARVKKIGVTDTKYIKTMLKEVIKDVLGEDQPIDFSSKPTVILVIGVNGVGKTTTIGKLAYNLAQQGKKVVIGAADTFRAAAIEQLEVWADRAGVAIVKHSQGADPAAVVHDAIVAGRSRNADVVIIDTAGRLHNKKHLMDELSKITRVINKEMGITEEDGNKVETLLVLDATTGQNGVSQAKLFKETADITGIVLTKLDGTAKGGVVIAIKNEVGLPVKYIGIGEQKDDLQPFSAADFVNALFE